MSGDRDVSLEWRLLGIVICLTCMAVSIASLMYTWYFLAFTSLATGIMFVRLAWRKD